MENKVKIQIGEFFFLREKGKRTIWTERVDPEIDETGVLSPEDPAYNVAQSALDAVEKMAEAFERSERVWGRP